jgi:hypothetical protein
MLESKTVHEQESARNTENGKKKNYVFCLHNDVLIDLFSFLDTTSLLRFQDSCHTVRKWVNDDSIWIDRWLWSSKKVCISPFTVYHCLIPSPSL